MGNEREKVRVERGESKGKGEGVVGYEVMG
jgi:hypothetical protein